MARFGTIFSIVAVQSDSFDDIAKMISIYLPQIQKGKDSILINDFHQAPIIPKSGYIPTGMQCGTSNSSVTANVDKLLTADVTSTGVVQVCPELHVDRRDWQIKNCGN